MRRGTGGILRRAEASPHHAIRRRRNLPTTSSEEIGVPCSEIRPNEPANVGKLFDLRWVTSTFTKLIGLVVHVLLKR